MLLTTMALAACSDPSAQDDAAEGESAASTPEGAAFVSIKEITLACPAPRCDRPEDPVVSLYFKVFVNGDEVRPLGIPSGDHHSSGDLLLSRGITAMVNDTFTVDDAEATLVIELWQRNAFARDVRLLSVAPRLERAAAGTQTFGESGNRVVVEVRH
jgi:hypothetical protein